MITQVMNFCNKHFIRTSESPDITFKDTSSVYTIEGDFAKTYLVGQYIYIYNSLLNDGAYLVTKVETGVLTVSTEVIAETPTATDCTVYIFGCAIPRDFINLVTDITTWYTANAGSEGVASERLDDYSIGYATGANGNTWTGAFASRLSQYRAIYSDLES